MPNYDYRCPVCEVTVERNVDMTNRDDQDCEKCCTPMERKFTFRGSVWSPTKNGGMS